MIKAALNIDILRVQKAIHIHSRYTGVARRLHTLHSLHIHSNGRGRKKWSSLEPLHSNFDSNSQTSCTAAKTGTPLRVLSARRRAKRGSWERHTHPYRYNKSYLYRNELLEMRAARYIFHPKAGKGKVSCCLASSAPFCSNKSTRAACNNIKQQ